MGEQGVIRVNVSVPRAVKARMDAVKNPPNWSAVATAAFEAKLLELESKKGVKDMDDVVARLKAAARLEVREDYQAGMEAGERWAKGEARPKQLRRLEKLVDDPEFPVEGHLEMFQGRLGMSDDGMYKGIPWHLCETIRGDDPDSWTDMEAFWEEVLGEKGVKQVGEYDFALGFVEGALEVWKKVKDRLWA